MAKSKITNISGGARGAYLNGKLVMAEAGETIETDEEVNEEWFAKAGLKDAREAAKPDDAGE